jgi:2-keto-4-pentenoate hydratase/2-oxohepta-3-ene-1,7-dioic acid hydratase in catechol pathway/regulator of RNase E activity RraA
MNEGPMSNTPLDRRPGKIIAVHLNYRSRAEQRGRTPKNPSYFLKPSSSLAASGGVVERPAGTELLAYEGEIAIIIGSRTRHASLEEARSSISGITAANDLGIYDMRAADKGSNLRSKGGDGFTPIGPGIIDATGLDLNKLRVRTWLNGKLVQEDTTDGLLFPFEQLVADLSQLVTLEPGDVILTGTPAGSSVAEPGDLIEVEVDAPHVLDAPTTGRLTTRVVEGERPFADFGEKPAVDEHQRAEAWGRTEVGQPATDWKELTASVGTAGLSSELRRRGYVDVFLDGVSPLRNGTKMAGPARTLRMIAFRPDLFAAAGDGYNAQKRAFDSLQTGEVLVIEARGDTSAGTVGDILALRAEALGAAGIVTDGCARDSAFFDTSALPVFSKGRHPSVLGRRHVPWEIDATITCGGSAIQTGDIIVGDSDGVIVIPAAIASDVIEAASARESEDEYIAQQVAGGARVEGLFPMNQSWRAKFIADTNHQSTR